MSRKLGTSQFLNEVALEDRCPFAHTLGLLGRRWRPALLWKMSQGLAHYGELRRALPRISDKMLAQELTVLSGNGLIVRDHTGSPVQRTAYRLTEAGRSLIPLLADLYRWGEDDLARRRKPFD